MSEKKISALHVAALQKIADGEDGQALPGHRVDTGTRKVFVRRGWLPGDVGWTSALTLTDEGRAALRKGLAAPPVLNASTAHTLTKIGQAGRDGHYGIWPGDGHSLGVAKAFGLVRSTAAMDWHTPNRWWLTHAGLAAAQAWEAQRRPATPTPSQARLLAELAREHAERGGAPPQLGHVYDSSTYDVCERNRWIRLVPYDDGTSRQRPELTDEGREAIDRYRDAKPSSGKPRPEPPTNSVAAADLTVEQTVRLVNARRYPDLTPEWVTVVDVDRKPRAGHMPGTVLVYVAGPDGQRLAYPTDAGVHPAVVFEVKEASSVE